MFNQKHEMGTKCGLSRQPLRALLQASPTEKSPRRIAEKTRHAYARERAEQKEHLDIEIVSLKELLNCGSIDEDTQTRFAKLLEMSYERKRWETREKYGFPDRSAQDSSDIGL